MSKEEFKDPKFTKDTGTTDSSPSGGKGTPGKKFKPGKKEFKKDKKGNYGCNDVSWYVGSDEIKNDVASLTYGEAIGLNYEIIEPEPIEYIENRGVRAVKSTTAMNTIPGGFATTSVPGIMVLRLMPLAGALDYDADNAFNGAAMRSFSFLRSKVSSAKDYDAPNVMQYYLCFGDILSAINWAQRAYGTCLTYAQKNRYYPETLLKAQGFDPSVAADMKRFKSILDKAIANASVFNVPSEIPLFDRRVFVYRYMYREDENVKSQVYMYAPQGFMYWDEEVGITTEDVWKPAIRFHSLGSIGGSTKLVDLDELEKILTKMITPMWLSQDFQNISAAVENAYGKAGCWAFKLINDDYAIEPVYNHEVLMQMKNAMYLRSIDEFNHVHCNYFANSELDDTGRYLPGQPYIIEDPTNQRLKYFGDNGLSLYKSSISRFTWANTKLLWVSDSQTPTQDETIINSRLKFNLDDNRISSIGTELVTSIDIWSAGMLARGLLHDGALHFDLFSTDWQRAASVNKDIGVGSSVIYDLYPGIHRDITDAIKGTPLDSYNMVMNPGGIADPAPFLNFNNSYYPLLQSLVWNSVLSQFKYHPVWITWMYQMANASTPPLSTRPEGVAQGKAGIMSIGIDMNTYTLQSHDVLRRMNYFAWLTLLHVPTVSK